MMLNGVNQWKGGLTRKNIAVGALTITALAAFYFGSQIYSSRKETLAAPQAAVQAEPRQALGYSAQKQDYNSIAQQAVEGLESHPDIANSMIQASLSALDRSGQRIVPETYIAMFCKIREKAEENPEITDHLGSNARAYIEKRTMEKYVSMLKRGVKESYETALKAGNRISDSEYFQRFMKEMGQVKDDLIRYIDSKRQEKGGKND